MNTHVNICDDKKKRSSDEKKPQRFFLLFTLEKFFTLVAVGFVHLLPCVSGKTVK